MHDKIKENTGIEKANCETCGFLGSDGDGPEYNGTWPVCDKIERMSNLKSFPFKKEMKCWYPNFWHSTFGRMVERGTDEEMDELGKAFKKAINTLP